MLPGKQETKKSSGSIFGKPVPSFSHFHRAGILYATLSIFVLLICLFYSYVFAFQVPELGIGINYAWIVTEIEPRDAHPGWRKANAEGFQSLQIGDQIVAFGDVTYQDYTTDRRRLQIDGYNPGDTLPITISRDRDRRIVHWQMPFVTPGYRMRYLVGVFFYLPFWFVGTAVLFFQRPRDARQWLLVSFCYLFAIWIATGLVSVYHVAGSALLINVITWLIVPISLHLHIAVPTPIFEHRRRFLIPLYVIAVILAVLELVQLLPHSAYSLGMLTFILGSLGLDRGRLEGAVLGKFFKGFFRVAVFLALMVGLIHYLGFLGPLKSRGQELFTHLKLNSQEVIHSLEQRTDELILKLKDSSPESIPEDQDPAL